MSCVCVCGQITELTHELEQETGRSKSLQEYTEEYQSSATCKVQCVCVCVSLQPTSYVGPKRKGEGAMTPLTWNTGPPPTHEL